MSEPAIIKRLPTDTTIDFAGAMNTPSRIRIKMTLVTHEHVAAMRETLNILETLLTPAPVAQLDEQGSSNSEDAGSSPAGCAKIEADR